MPEKYLQILTTPSVGRAQAHYYGRSRVPAIAPERDPLGPEEQSFVLARDSFYLATVSESGWPYLQHRGGAPGFLQVVDHHTLAFADYSGNRQLLSTGNLAVNDKVALFLMDYPNRTRLKILGHGRVVDAREHLELVAKWAETRVHAVVERLFMIDVISFDWNCPKYITPRYTVAEVESAVAPLRQRIAELEAQIKHHVKI